ncbi:hypothetical protein [Streptomyces sp. B6B3]|uniref:tryptophan biosynthesis modulator TrpM n=1 Tax=Streptomyces sp. B6B3 TaxID=3153570 RepID=UPI00325E3279
MHGPRASRADGAANPPRRTPARARGHLSLAPRGAAGLAVTAAARPGDRFSGLARGAGPRGCRAPARRILGRRVRYHIGCEPGQTRGRRWR